MAEPEHARRQRPRLSLQTKPVHGSGIRTRNCFSRADPKSPTAFNTLSNIYVTAIERSTPTTRTNPLATVKFPQPLKLRTDPDTLQSHQRVVPSPLATAPGTPLSANPKSPVQQVDIVYPSTMTATPPLSAGSVDTSRKIFTFNPNDVNRQLAPPSPAAQTRRNVKYAGFPSDVRAPYSLNKCLHSILRNSPLQPMGMRSPSSPRKHSVRIQERVERRVGYDSPLTQTIITEKYTRSHIDLLAEDASPSPYTPSPTPEDSDIALDLTAAYPSDETRDGGETPGPFENMRRRMTGLSTKTSVPSPRLDGIRKRKSKDKKRKWVWTIGKDDDEIEGGALAAIRAAAGETFTPRSIPQPAVEPDSINGAGAPEKSAAIKICVDLAGSEPGLTADTDGDLMDTEMEDSDASDSTAPPRLLEVD
ncbi:hypothetical protein F4861DRAFT_20470 [Xylaria intraflava]|nr:hypothetical protein F4861DRAFT_20470 [Xylaria intraflava]